MPKLNIYLGFEKKLRVIMGYTKHVTDQHRYNPYTEPEIDYHGTQEIHNFHELPSKVLHFNYTSSSGQKKEMESKAFNNYKLDMDHNILIITFEAFNIV
jgi:hypothetical protein